MKGTDLAARDGAIRVVLAPRAPVVPAARFTLLAAVVLVLLAADLPRPREHAPTAPTALTAEAVREAARSRDAAALGEAARQATRKTTGDRGILVGSLGLDLTAPAIRAALVDRRQGGELRLARIGHLVPRARVSPHEGAAPIPPTAT